MRILDPQAASYTEAALLIAELRRKLRAELSRVKTLEAELSARRAVDTWLLEDPSLRCLTVSPCGAPVASVLAPGSRTVGIHTFAHDYRTLAETLRGGGK